MLVTAPCPIAAAYACLACEPGNTANEPVPEALPPIKAVESPPEATEFLFAAKPSSPVTCELLSATPFTARQSAPTPIWAVKLCLNISYF